MYNPNGYQPLDGQPQRRAVEPGQQPYMRPSAAAYPQTPYPPQMGAGYTNSSRGYGRQGAQPGIRQPGDPAPGNPAPGNPAPGYTQPDYQQTGYQQPVYAHPGYDSGTGANPSGAYGYDGRGASAGYVPPNAKPTPQAPAKTRGKRSGKPGGKKPVKSKKKKSWVWQLAKPLLILLVLAGAGVGGYIIKTQNEVRPYLGVFLDNISVDGIDLSGRTWEEGSALVWAQLNEKQNGWYVRLRNTNGDYNDITAATLGISFDPTNALAQAWAIGHDVDTANRKTIFELRDEIAHAKNTTNAFFSVEQSANTAPIDEILQTLEKAAYLSPQSAQMLGFNPDDDANPFIYQNEVYGRQLNTAGIRQRIFDLVQRLESGEVLLETETLMPAVTVAQLQKQFALRFRATTPIDHSSSEDRTNNVRVACSKINGKTVADGAKFSFNSVVGKRTFENGFASAIEYAYGEERLGVGGGTCQVSTTVYLAAIQAGMEIVKRSPHSNPVSYTQVGMDATVSDTKGREVDFVFRNRSGGTIYMAAHVIQRGTSKSALLCEVRIYGPSLENTGYVLESVTLETLAKPTEPTLRDDENQQYVVYTDEKKRTYKGHDGYVVETYLCTYVDNVQTQRELAYKDTYPARADVYYVGTVMR